MDYDTNQLIPFVEVIDIDDPKLKAVWGEKLYRLKLVIHDSGFKGKATISLK